VSTKKLPPEFYKCLEELQAIDFAIVELQLYLDTHPNDHEAIQQFNELAKERKRLKKTIETMYGPLQQFGNSFSGYPWNWNDPPWPWQI